MGLLCLYFRQLRCPSRALSCRVLEALYRRAWLASSALWVLQFWGGVGGRAILAEPWDAALGHRTQSAVFGCAQSPGLSGTWGC